ncbi:MAG: hypothetical protein DRJ15_15985, partial [Bacteroidetes bacterium]
MALVSVSVIPLVLSLWMVGAMVSSELEVQMQLRAQDSANFIEHTTTSISTENLTLVQMLAGNSNMINAVYSDGVSGGNAQLARVFADLVDLPFDQVQVLNGDGQRLYRGFINGN